jgi:deoxyguanosine kinase
MLIAVDGPIGVGKTTLAENLARALGCPMVEEAYASHPFLEKFYHNMQRHALETEIGFLLINYHWLRECDQLLEKGMNVVVDFTLAKSLIFAALDLPGADERAAFDAVYRVCEARVPTTDVLVLLDAPSDELHRRVQLRGRKIEAKITENYLNDLRNGYLNSQPAAQRVVRLCTAEHDFRLPSSVSVLAEAILS